MKQHNWYSTFLLIFVCLLFFSYQNHFDNPFFLEDENTIVNNNSIRNSTSISTYFTNPGSHSVDPNYASYQPGLTALNSYDIQWGGEDFPFAKQFHKTNFILYVLLAILLYAFFLEIFIIAHPHKWNSMFVLFATSFFCLHTTQAETLNYISSRGHLIATIMVILGFIFYMYKTRWRKYFHYLVPVIVGFTFHISALLFVPLLFFYKFIIEEKDGFTKDGKKYVFLIFPFIFFIACLILFFKMVPGIPESNVNSYLQILSADIGNFFFPVNLSFFNDHSPSETLFDLKIISALGFILLFSFIAFRTYKIRQLRPVSFGIIWFFLSHHFIYHFENKYPGEHSTFLSYIGLVLALTCAVSYFAVKYQQKLEENQNRIIVLCSAAVIFLMFHSYGVIKRNEVWDTKKDFWTDAIQKSPDHPMVNFHYGLVEKENGNMESAKKHFSKVLASEPENTDALLELALLTEDNVEALKKLTKVYAMKDKTIYFFERFARFLVLDGKLQDARQVCIEGLEISPAHVGLLNIEKEISKQIK